MEYLESPEKASDEVLFCRVNGHTPSRDLAHYVLVVTSTDRRGDPKTGERRVPCHWGCGKECTVRYKYVRGKPVRQANIPDYKGTSGFLQKPKAQRERDGTELYTRDDFELELLLRGEHAAEERARQQTPRKPTRDTKRGRAK
jgi:hypothetical protein